uniref:Cytochrome P450 n=1 Tax=Compsopogon caeruleus TaxID=31354 RepID=A0A7S1X9P9_9RHOD
MEVDLYEEMLPVAVEAIARSGFGMSKEHLQKNGEELIMAFKAIFMNMDGGSTAMQRARFILPYIIPPWLIGWLPLTPMVRRKRAIEILRGKVEWVILERIKQGPVENNMRDLLDSLLSLTQLDSENSHMRKDELLSHCMTFLSAGSSTTISLMSTVLSQLALHPRCAEKLRKELLEAFPSGLESSEDVEKVDQLSYLDAVYRECIRMYPPVPVSPRVANKDTSVGNYRFPKGSYIVLPIAAIQVKKSLWGPDADLFRPERWLKSPSGGATSPFAFIPFIYGPRSCIGSRFAILETKTVVAHVMLSGLRLSIAPASEFRQFTFVSSYSGLNVRITGAGVRQ